MRLRMTFGKNKAMRYTGHLDVQRALERTFRRCCLPLAYSQGFSPHAKINLAAPLPLGFTSEGEVADFWLDEELPVDSIEKRLRSNMPPGLDLVHLEQAQNNEPSLQTRVLAAFYRITSPELRIDVLHEVSLLLEKERIMRIRRQKEYDLRPLILSISTVIEDETTDGGLHLYICLNACEGKTGRPEEVLDALQITPQRALIHRMKLVFSPL